jgi:hypothetical protein
VTMSVPSWTHQCLARQGVNGLMSVMSCPHRGFTGCFYRRLRSQLYFNTKITRCRLEADRIPQLPCTERNLFWHHYGKWSIRYGHCAAT